MDSRDTEYIESSHRSILRGISNAYSDQPRQKDRPRSQRPLERDRYRTPLPSSGMSHTATPRPLQTISPVSPELDRRGTFQSSPRQHVQFEPGNPSPSVKIPHTIPSSSASTEYDPASTYQPRRIVPVALPQHAAHPVRPSLNTEERSFIEWDDCPSKLQLMKQSLGFRRSGRFKKLSAPPRPKPPDDDLNANPRTISLTRSKQEIYQSTSTSLPPAARSQLAAPLPDPSQWRSHPIHISTTSADLSRPTGPSNSEQRYHHHHHHPPLPRMREPSKPTHGARTSLSQHPQVEPTSTTLLPRRAGQASRPERHAHHGPRSPPHPHPHTHALSVERTHTQNQARHIRYVSVSASASTRAPPDNANADVDVDAVPRSRRIRSIVHGVVKRVSRRDLRGQKS